MPDAAASWHLRRARLFPDHLDLVEPHEAEAFGLEGQNAGDDAFSGRAGRLVEMGDDDVAVPGGADGRGGLFGA